MTNDLTPERLAAIEARAEAATGKPWFATPVPDKLSDNGPDFWLIDAVSEKNQETEVAELCHKPGDKAKHNAAFIAHARTDIPDLLAAYKAAQEENERLERHITAARSFLVLNEPEQAARKLAEAINAD